MSPPEDEDLGSQAGGVARGVAVLRRLQEEETYDLRRLDLPGFRRWLGRQGERWQHDPVFVQRVRIRELYREHCELRELDRRRRRLAAAAAASPSGVRLRQVEYELQGAARAVEGLTAALAEAEPSRKKQLQQKRDEFLGRQEALAAERERLVAACPQHRELAAVEAALGRLRGETGLGREEEALAELLRRQGQRSGRSGGSFEKAAVGLTRQHIVPELTRCRGEVQVLTGVTLGAARVEFDQLVVCQPEGRERPVDVLAAVEVKRNINDLAHGFRRRQEDLVWLTGRLPAGDNRESFRTQTFPRGEFDREVVHTHEGRAFVFGRRSFRRFQRDPATGHVLARLYFVTRRGPLWGVSSAVLGRIALRLASDARLDNGRAARQARFWQWCVRQADRLEAPDVLALYAASPRRARQVLIVG